MKLKYLISFLVLILILGSCSKENNTNELSVNNKQIETAKNEIFSDNKEVIESSLLNVWVNDFKKELSKNDALIIDLRTTKELEETWIIPWARQIDFYSKDLKEKLNKLDKNAKYLIYCRSWNRSGQTLWIMDKLWFKNVIELRWWMNDWLSSGEKTVNISELNNEEFNIKNSINDDMMMDNENMGNMMPKTVILNAQKWEFNQKIIKVKKGQKLIIKVNNTDGLHWIAIPSMKIMNDNEIEVDTSKSWEYEFRCLNYCWEWHQEMVWKIIIE